MLRLPQGVLLCPVLLKFTVTDLEKQVENTVIKFPGDAQIGRPSKQQWENHSGENTEGPREKRNEAKCSEMNPMEGWVVGGMDWCW